MKDKLGDVVLSTQVVRQMASSKWAALIGCAQSTTGMTQLPFDTSPELGFGIRVTTDTSDHRYPLRNPRPPLCQPQSAVRMCARPTRAASLPCQAAGPPAHAARHDPPNG